MTPGAQAGITSPMSRPPRIDELVGERCPYLRCDHGLDRFSPDQLDEHIREHHAEEDHDPEGDDEEGDGDGSDLRSGS